MMDIKHAQELSPNSPHIGGKAKNLLLLQSLGLLVPDFLVLPADVLQKGLTGTTESTAQIAGFQFPTALLNKIKAFVKDKTFVAVRSSALLEDGRQSSFAGQFKTELFVTEANLEQALKSVWASAYSQSIERYKAQLQIEGDAGIAIIIQEMIAVEKAGVAFGVNPSSPEANQQLVNAVFGQGEGLVSGELNSDQYSVSDGEITQTIAEKVHQFVWNEAEGYGLIKINLPSHLTKQSVLSKEELEAVISGLKKIESATNMPQDIEFGWLKGDLYLFQTRPITTLKNIKDNYTVWDNSNIIESYPGVTTPLTFSFISASYKTAYELFSGYMGVSSTVRQQNQQVFENTLGLIKGRVYYNLRSWYLMLAMLPGYSINARYMETMMGVKERFDVPASYSLSKGKAWWSILKMAFSMLKRMFQLASKRRHFMRLLEETIKNYQSLPYTEMSAADLMQRYKQFEQTLLNEWKAPLLNDFFAMIWFGMLQKNSEKYIKSDNKNIHNDLLCGSSDIISVQPIHRTIAIADYVQKEPSLNQLFETHDPAEIWRQLSTNTNEIPDEFHDLITNYLQDFGERCIGELKLETLSFSQRPEKFIKVLKSYVQQGITQQSLNSGIEEELRSKAEEELNAKLRFKPFKKWWLKLVLRQARSLVSMRENLRYERTRAFGVVRKIFSALGEKFHQQSLIAEPRDIFYLSKEEIFAYIEGRSIQENIKEIIHTRKEEFQNFAAAEAPPERFSTHGVVYANDLNQQALSPPLTEGDLQGIGCCPGKVRAKVRYVNTPEEVDSINGDILITSSTDPGWVTLFPTASGIIVERGSLLSHSAIVSREMGIPCIVGVSGLLQRLKDGDMVEMDGASGFIKVIEDKK